MHESRPTYTPRHASARKSTREQRRQAAARLQLTKGITPDARQLNDFFNAGVNHLLEAEARKDATPSVFPLGDEPTTEPLAA